MGKELECSRELLASYLPSEGGRGQWRREKVPERAAGSVRNGPPFLDIAEALEARAAVWLYWGLARLSIAKVCLLFGEAAR